MAEISELEQRINAALDAISKGIEAKEAAMADASSVMEGDADLQEELEIERATNARLVSSREKHVARIERLETRVARLTERLAATEQENKRLEDVVDALHENNAQLRSGMGADESLTAELKQMRAARAADRAELDDILAEMAPIVKEA